MAYLLIWKNLRQKNYYDYNNLVDLLVFNLSWASKEASDYTHMWNQINTIQKLLKFKVNHEGLSIYINSIITNIASDEDIEGYLSSEINAACDMMVKMFLEYKTCPGPETSYEVLDSDNKTKVFEVKTYFDKSNKCTMSVTGLLMSLYKLSVNYEIKKRINNYTGFMLTLFDLIYTGIDIEKEHAINLLSQLAFDENIKKDFLENLQLLNYLQKQECREDFEYLRLKTSIHQFLWFLKKEIRQEKKEEKLKKSKKHTTISEQHIMISYNSATRELCLKIKEFLEKANHKVWIDVCDINGSSLESMAKAVENSYLILMCVTEKYRLSKYCQMEATYASKHNKIIIPCIMQKGYGNINGWLGMIMLDLIFIDFIKHDLKRALDLLLQQVKLRLNKTPSPVQSFPQPKTGCENKVEKTDAKSQPVEKWSESDVEKWFRNNKVDSIYEILKPLDGKVLTQMNEMRIHTPEFFFKSLTQSEKADFKSVALFTVLLKELF